MRSLKRFLFNPLCLCYEIFKRGVGVDAPACLFCCLPILPVSYDCRVEGPERTGSGFYRMDPAPRFYVIEDAVEFRVYYNANPPIFRLTKLAHKYIRSNGQESGDLFYIPCAHKNPSLTKTTLTTPSALKDLRHDLTRNVTETGSSSSPVYQVLQLPVHQHPHPAVCPFLPVYKMSIS